MRHLNVGGVLMVACAGAALGSGCSGGGSSSTTSQPFAGASVSGTAGIAPPVSPAAQPTLPATVIASPVPPPPISGGTLVVTHDGNTVIVADPDRDAVYVVDVAAQSVRFTVALQAGDEPGRVAEDAAGLVHVALRGSGMLATIDPKQGTVTARRAVCPAPRGVAYDPSTDNLFVACATGELVTLPGAGGPATRSMHVERDLRDVVVQNGALSVSSFRSAEILRIAADGAITRRDALPSPDSQFVPHVAWRATAGPGGSIVAVHQAESTLSLSTTTPGGYGAGGMSGGGASGPLSFDAGLPVPSPIAIGPVETSDASAPVQNDVGSFLTGSSGAVMSVLTIMGPDGTVTANRMVNGVLPVDVAISSTGAVAVVAPGSAFTPMLDTVITFDSSGNEADFKLAANAQPISVGFVATGQLVTQTREPATLWVTGGDVFNSGASFSIALSASSRDDTGHDIFHTQAGALIACASCHPEGGDDGHVWILDGNQRRTPSLRGTIAGTAPYHWPGDQMDLPTLVNDVYIIRMSGQPLTVGQMGTLTDWVQTIPAPPAPTWVDPVAASLGRAIFARADVGCATCHSGAKFTNNATVDVGTGGKFQVPPLLGVGWRTPLMHDGCATNVADRFGACSTAPHGNVSSLSPTDIGNLTAYLETL